jgi:multisubunit Na+/H+ antiporter MnhB subunit
MTTLVTRIVSRGLLAPAFMVAFAIMIKGYVDTGDGFAAGCIAALAVLLQYVAFGPDVVERTLPVRYAPGAVAMGLAISLVVTFWPVVIGRSILTHAPLPDQHAIHFGALELLTAMAFDVGVFLVVLGFSVSTIRLIAGLGQGRSSR